MLTSVIDSPCYNSFQTVHFVNRFLCYSRFMMAHGRCIRGKWMKEDENSGGNKWSREVWCTSKTIRSEEAANVVENINTSLPWDMTLTLQDFYHYCTRLLNAPELFLFKIYSLYQWFTRWQTNWCFLTASNTVPKYWNLTCLHTPISELTHTPVKQYLFVGRTLQHSCCCTVHVSSLHPDSHLTLTISTWIVNIHLCKHWELLPFTLLSHIRNQMKQYLASIK